MSCVPVNPNAAYNDIQNSNGSQRNEFLKLPAWFVEKPDIEGINLAYAYSSQYWNNDTEKTKLLLSAAENIAKSKRIKMTVTQTGTLQTGKFVGKTDIVESEIKKVEENLENLYTIIDQFHLEKCILALAVETSQLQSFNSKTINTGFVQLNIQSPPDWVMMPPVRKGFVFGIGVAQDHSSPEKAWIVAEKNARADIAFQNNLRMIDVNEDYQRSMWEWLVRHHKTMSTVLLRNVAIIRHGYCKTDRTYYALARMRVINAEETLENNIIGNNRQSKRGKDG